MVEKRIKRSIRKKNWSKLFDQLDENGDGVLNYQEFWRYKEIRTSMQLSEALNKFDVSELGSTQHILCGNSFFITQKIKPTKNGIRL